MTNNKTNRRDTTDTTNGIAQHFTFGVEIETAVPRANELNIGSYSGSGIQVSYLPAGWVAKSDGSINAPSGHEGCEIVSPILKGEDGIRQVIEVCRVLNERGHKVNASCGVHVHVGFKVNPVSGKATSAKELETLVQIASYLEEGLYASTGTMRRRNGSFSEQTLTQTGGIIAFLATFGKSLSYHHSHFSFSVLFSSSSGKKCRPLLENSPLQNPISLLCPQNGVGKGEKFGKFHPKNEKGFVIHMG